MHFKIEYTPSVQQLAVWLSTFQPTEIWNMSWSSKQPLFIIEALDTVSEEISMHIINNAATDKTPKHATIHQLHRALNGANASKQWFFNTELEQHINNEVLRKLYCTIAHGDYEHKLWLYNEMATFEQTELSVDRLTDSIKHLLSKEFI